MRYLGLILLACILVGCQDNNKKLFHNFGELVKERNDARHGEGESCSVGEEKAESSEASAEETSGDN